MNIEKRIRLIMILATLLVIAIGGLTFYYLNNLTDRINLVIMNNELWMDKIENLNNALSTFMDQQNSLDTEDFIEYIHVKKKVELGELNQTLLQETPLYTAMEKQKQLCDSMIEIAKEGQEDLIGQPRHLLREMMENLTSYRDKIEILVEYTPYFFDKSTEAIEEKVSNLNATKDEIENQKKNIEVLLNQLRLDQKKGEDVQEKIWEQENDLENKTKELEDYIRRIDETRNLGVRKERTDQDLNDLFKDYRSVLFDLSNQVDRSIKKLYEDRNRAFAMSGSEVKAIGEDAIESMLIILIAAVVLGLLLTLLAPQNVSLPMKRLITLINDIKDGHYNISRKLETNDDIGILFRHLHSLIKTQLEIDSLKANQTITLHKRFGLLANHFDPIIITELNTEIVYVSEPFAELFGVVPQEMTYKKVDDQPLPEELKEHIKYCCSHHERLENISCKIQPQSNTSSDDEEGSEKSAGNRTKKVTLSSQFIRNHQGEISEVVFILELPKRKSPAASKKSNSKTTTKSTSKKSDSKSSAT